MKQVKTATTYTIQATNISPYGLNQDYYFRTEGEMKRRLAELREWYKNIPSQKFSTSSHQIQI
jgi:hypothetical protein